MSVLQLERFFDKHFKTGKGGHPAGIMEPIRIPIDDVLDLHTFRPQDIPDLLNAYFSECIKEGIFSVRVIHGKGKGIQKRRVHQILDQHPLVRHYTDAPPEAGGWGATVVSLDRKT